jgi:SOS-response transcriptional repressor LexA
MVAAITCPCCGYRLAQTPLTPTQQTMLSFIRKFRANHGISPSYAEIQKGLRYASRAPVFYVVQRLVERGALLRGPKDAARTLIPADEVAAA